MPRPEQLEIAFFGSSLVSSFWNGAATYYRGIIKALAERGHRITFYEPDAFDRQRHRDIEDPTWARVVVYEPNPAGAGRALLTARNADILVKASGVGVLDDWLEQEVLNLPQAPRASRTTIYWDVDAPATLERLHGNPNDPLRQHLAHYDFILTYGGGEPVVNAFTAFGARHCEPIYNAVDPEVHFPAVAEPGFRASLSFLGNRLPDREERVHEFFFKPVSRLSSAEFILGGSGWDAYAPQFDNLRYLGHVYTADHNAFNASPKAVLNINRASMARTGFSPATRVFEAAGAGACLITDNWEGVEQFLEPGREILVADSGDDVIEHLRGLTAARSAQIGTAARRRVLAEHTYRHRALQFERLMASRLERKSA